jgi:hypothetical protein
MDMWLRSATGKLILVNLGVALGVLIGYRNGYRGVDLAVLGAVVFSIGNVGGGIGLVIAKFFQAFPNRKRF